MLNYSEVFYEFILNLCWFIKLVSLDIFGRGNWDRLLNSLNTVFNVNIHFNTVSQQLCYARPDFFPGYIMTYLSSHAGLLTD